MIFFGLLERKTVLFKIDEGAAISFFPLVIIHMVTVMIQLILLIVMQSFIDLFCYLLIGV